MILKIIFLILLGIINIPAFVVSSICWALEYIVTKVFRPKYFEIISYKELFKFFWDF